MVQIVPLVARPEGSPQARRPCEALFRPTHHLAPARRTGMEAYHQPIQRVMHYGALKAVGSFLGEKLPGKNRPVLVSYQPRCGAPKRTSDDVSA